MSSDHENMELLGPLLQENSADTIFFANTPKFCAGQNNRQEDLVVAEVAGDGRTICIRKMATVAPEGKCNSVHGIQHFGSTKMLIVIGEHSIHSTAYKDNFSRPIMFPLFF